MKIFVAPYQMKLKPGWSRNHSGEGALIKIEDVDGFFGFSDLHPWPSLGDESLVNQIELIQANKPTPLAQRALQLALVDLQLRKQEHASINIENHLLVMNLADLHRDLFENGARFFSERKVDLLTSGVCVKVKVGLNYQQEGELLNKIYSNYPNIIWRLDFNELLSLDEFILFWSSLNLKLRSQIQYCEDPTCWSDTAWQKLYEMGVPLACDRVLDRLLSLNSRPEIGAEAGVVSSSSNPWYKNSEILKLLNLSAFVVLKPAQRDCFCFVKDFLEHSLSLNQGHTSKSRFVLTSYLDHPVGIMHALVEAIKIKKNYPEFLSVCGLNSMLAYQKFDFDLAKNIQHISGSNNKDRGIGFTKELMGQNWIYCSQF
jgi:O-succinylbenzoate synthase